MVVDNKKLPYTCIIAHCSCGSSDGAYKLNHISNWHASLHNCIDVQVQVFSYPIHIAVPKCVCVCVCVFKDLANYHNPLLLVHTII